MINAKNSKLNHFTAPLLIFLTAFSVIAFGAGIISVGANSSSITYLAAIAAFALIGAVVWTMLELPVLIFVRMAFIASFFIKTEISLFKLMKSKTRRI